MGRSLQAHGWSSHSSEIDLNIIHIKANSENSVYKKFEAMKLIFNEFNSMK